MKIFGKTVARALCGVMLVFALASTPVLTGCWESKKDRIIREQREIIAELKEWVSILAWGGGAAAGGFLVVGNMMGSKTRRDEREQEEDGEE